MRANTPTAWDPISCWTAAAFPQTFVEALRMVRPGGVVVEAGTFVDMGPVGINPNSDICTRNVSVIGIGGETATSYLPAMRLMAANLSAPAVRSHRHASHAAGTGAGRRGTGADRCGDEDRDGAERCVLCLSGNSLMPERRRHRRQFLMWRIGPASRNRRCPM